jgi:environmental stress-induced protein Ves
MPWKDGGGETREVALSPLDAGIDAFDWRISMAWVREDGSFSTFPDVDRTLVLLDGDGMTLAIAGRTPVALTVDSAPWGFPGDVATFARLAGGPITDLNVMTARGRYAHVVERFANPRVVRAGSHSTVLLLGDGAAVDVAAESVTLAGYDMALLEPGEAAHVRPSEGTACLLVAIRPVDA